jgi:uncharacterized protein (TIGR03067 family)
MPTDLDRLQGTWHVASLETDGQKMPASAFAGSHIIVTKNRFRSVAMGTTYAGTIELNEKKTPKTLDLVFEHGPEEGNRNVGVYKLAGDRWTICLAMHGTTRPKSFATKAGTGIALETLRRGTAVTSKTARAKVPPARAVADLEAATADAVTSTGTPTVIEGEWPMVSGVFSGVAMDKSMVAWARRVTRGDTTSVVAGPQVLLKAHFTLDDSSAPHTIDYDNLAGANKGKKQAGIWEIDGDTLRVCMSAPGKPRPKDFVSTKGDGRSFTTWRRQTK